MSGWGPSWQPHGTRDSGSSWKPRAWWDQEASLFTTSEWHWVPVSGHDEPGDHHARSQSHDNCFTESIPLNSPLGKLLLFSFLMRFSWQSLTPVSPADLNTYLFGAYFIKGKEERTGGEIGRRWTGADEAHAFTLRRRAISLRGDGYQASNLFQEACVLSRSAGQACGQRGSLSMYFASPSTMLSLDHRGPSPGLFPAIFLLVQQPASAQLPRLCTWCSSSSSIGLWTEVVQSCPTLWPHRL